MIRVIDAARYLVSLDSYTQYFNKNLVHDNHNDFDEGNTRLNIILHLAQNIYIGKHGRKLIDTDFYACNNGSVIPEIQEKYDMILATRDVASFQMDDSAKDFLRKVFGMLKDAPIYELIDIDKEDPAWKEKYCFYLKNDKLLESMKHIADYRDRYEAANFYIDRIKCDETHGWTNLMCLKDFYAL